MILPQFNPFSCWWTFGLVLSSVWAITDSADMNILSSTSPCGQRCSLLFRYIPRNRIARSERRCIYNFSRNCQTIFQTGFTTLHTICMQGKSFSCSPSLSTFGRVHPFHFSHLVSVFHFSNLVSHCWKVHFQVQFFSLLLCSLTQGAAPLDCSYQLLYQLAAGQVQPIGGTGRRLKGRKKRKARVFLFPLVSPATSPPWLQLLAYRPPWLQLLLDNPHPWVPKTPPSAYSPSVLLYFSP